MESRESLVNRLILVKKEIDDLKKTVNNTKAVIKDNNYVIGVLTRKIKKIDKQKMNKNSQIDCNTNDDKIVDCNKYDALKYDHLNGELPKVTNIKKPRAKKQKVEQAN